MPRRYLAAILLVVLSASAQTNTAEQLYNRGMDALSGSGPSRNDLDAIDYFKRSAEIGYLPAQVALGSFYDSGTLLPGSDFQAAEWYRKAAEKGDPLAQWLLGRVYFNGNGIPQDFAAAEKWLQQSADQGNPFGQYLLGRLYSDRDYTKAPPFFLAAAQQGLPQSQFHYAKILKEGRGITQDRFNAYVWLVMSLDGGYPAARNDLTELEEMEGTITRSVIAHGCTGWDGELSAIPAPPPLKIQRFCH
jgi:TPR repeat protein